MEEPPTDKQKKGTDVHKQIETYLLTGEMVLGKTALAGKHFLPEPKTVDVEHKLESFRLAGVEIVGSIDCLNTSYRWIDHHGETQALPETTTEIIDWKTTSSVAQYAKRGEELYSTIQMPLYGMYAASKDPLVTDIRLSHVYFQTKGAPCSIKSTAIFPVDKIRERTKGIEALIESMKQAAQLQAVEQLPPNTNACQSFGRRCSFWDHCPRSSAQHMATHFEEGEANMGLFDKLTKSTEHTMGVVVPANGPIQKPEPLPQRIEVVAPPQPKAPTQADIDAAVKALEAEERKALEAFGAVLPPDTKPSVTGTYEPEPAPKKTRAKKAEVAQASLSVTTKPLGEILQEIQEVAKEREEAVQAAYDAADKEVGTNQIKSILGMTISTQDRILAEAATPSAHTLELFVNVSVSGVECNDLRHVINKALKEIEGQYKVSDIRLSSTAPLAFGGWKGVLATVIKSYNLEGRWLAFGSGDFINVAIEALESQATLLVKGS
jgi:hypothetical protein